MKNIVVEGQISLFDLPIIDTKVEEFKITDEEIEAFLLKGSGFSEGKKRIYEHFIKQPYNNAFFLKEEYGIGGGNCAISSSGYTPYKYDSKGIKIEKRDESKRAEITLNWNQVATRIEKLIKENRYLTKEEKIKYELVREKPVANKENTEIDKIIKHYKDTCRFIVKGEHGVMIHLNNKAFFYGYDGKKTSINSSFVPPKPLGKVLVDNIGAYKKSTVLDKKVTEVANKSAEMDIKLTKGQAVKVCLGGKERTGEVWRLQSNGGVSVYFKDTNSIGAYPRKFIKAVKEKLKIRLLEDCKDVKEDFLKGNVYEVWMEQPENYIIRIDGVAYGPLKKSCERVN